MPVSSCLLSRFDIYLNTDSNMKRSLWFISITSSMKKSSPCLTRNWLHHWVYFRVIKLIQKSHYSRQNPKFNTLSFETSILFYKKDLPYLVKKCASFSQSTMIRPMLNWRNSKSSLNWRLKQTLIKYCLNYESMLLILDPTINTW